MRSEGTPIVGYTWWPLFDMYEWTWRHTDRSAPRPPPHDGPLRPRRDRIGTPALEEPRRRPLPRTMPLPAAASLPHRTAATRLNARTCTRTPSPSTRFTHRRHQPPPLRLVRRAPRPVRLRRHLRAGPPDRRRGRLPHRRHRPRQGARRHRPSATRAATSSPATAGRTASARASSGPRRLDLAWHSTETNEVGPARVPGLAGQGRQRADARGQPRHPRRRRRRSTCSSTRTIPSRHRALRRRAVANGRTEPFGVRMWCLGNEMDGPWQLGHRIRRRLRQARAPDRAGDAAARPRRSSSSSAARSSASHADLRRVGARRARAHLRRRRLHLLPRLLRGERRRPRQLPRLRRRHGPLHRVRRRDRRPREGRAAAATRRSTSRSTSGTSGTSTATTSVDKIDGHRQLAGGAAAARGRLLRRRRRRLRQPADLAAEARRPGHQRLPRPAGQRDRADHDRAGRPRLAADHLLPVRADLAARIRVRAASSS